MKRGKYVATGILRLLTLRPCREPFCKERVRCWRWHVEVFTCPTCKREVDEYDPQFGAVLDALAPTPWATTFVPKPPGTWTGATTESYVFQNNRTWPT